MNKSLKIVRKTIMTPAFSFAVLFLNTYTTAKTENKNERRFYISSDHFLISPSIRASYPQIASINLNVLIDHTKSENNPNAYKGILIHVEPGFQGFKTGIGYGAFGELGYAASVRANYYSPWIDIIGFRKQEKYIGGEISLSGFLASYTCGLYTGLNKESASILATVGIGFGLF